MPMDVWRAASQPAVHCRVCVVGGCLVQDGAEVAGVRAGAPKSTHLACACFARFSRLVEACSKERMWVSPGGADSAGRSVPEPQSFPYQPGAHEISHTMVGLSATQNLGSSPAWGGQGGAPAIRGPTLGG